MRYAKIIDEEVKIITTATVIPDEGLVKKGLLKIVDVKPSVKAWESIVKDGYDVGDEVSVKYKVLAKSLDDYKQERINDLKTYIGQKFPASYKQINALLGEYSDEKCASIKSEVAEWRAYIDSFEAQLLDCESCEEVAKVDFLTEEDKEELL